jgi:hypothetical protein
VGECRPGNGSNSALKALILLPGYSSCLPGPSLNFAVRLPALQSLCLLPSFCSSNDIIALYIPGEGPFT